MEGSWGGWSYGGESVYIGALWWGNLYSLPGGWPSAGLLGTIMMEHIRYM